MDKDVDYNSEQLVRTRWRRYFTKPSTAQYLVVILLVTLPFLGFFVGASYVHITDFQKSNEQVNSLGGLEKVEVESSCNSFKGIYAKSSCVIDSAQKFGKLETCNGIVGDLSGVKINVAIRNLARCYSAVGIAIQDLNVCRALPEFSGDSGTSGDYIKTQCIEGIAVASSNVDICEEIHEWSKREYVSARDSCYMKLAEATNNPIFCEEVTKETVAYGISNFCRSYLTPSEQ